MRQSAGVIFSLLFLTLLAFAFAASSISIQNTTRINPGPLGALISANPNHTKVGHAVSFLCTARGGVSPYTYFWSFGDGSTGTGPSLTHSYSSTGVKLVVCTITDTIGSVAANQTTVTVT